MARKKHVELGEEELENLQIDGEVNEAIKEIPSSRKERVDGRESSAQESVDVSEYVRPDQNSVLLGVENEELRDPEDPDQKTAKPGKPTKSKHKYSTFYFVIFIALALLAGVIFWLLRGIILDAPEPQIEVQKTTPKEIVAKEQSNPELERFINPTTGEKWHSTPKKMEKQGWMKAELRESFDNTWSTPSQIDENMKNSAPEYFEVGVRGENKIVRVTDNYNGFAPSYVWFEQSPNEDVTYIVRPQSTSKNEADLLKWAKDIVTAEVEGFSESIHYDSLSIPSEITLKNKEVLRRPEYDNIGPGFQSFEGLSKTLVSQLGQSRLYRVEKPYADTQLTNISYEIEMPAGTSATLAYQPNSESLEGYVFDNANPPTYYDSYSKTTLVDGIHAIARGCGGAGANVTRTDALKLADLKPVGKTPTGRIVYQPKDKDSTLVKKTYDEYKNWVENAKSLDEFLADHGLLLIENGDHDLLVYVRDSMGPSGGCAKPVVYLYPKQETNVSVRVGAEVTVSEPKYESDGWQGVVARPNGLLTYRGEQYNSLFWEGYGVGAYPGITSGTVVKRDQAATTMRYQLAQQGLNNKEIVDFMEFWEPRVPNKPYIRLTWLDTHQMEAVAPLRVSPKPDTLLRVFLDMDGYDWLINLPAQKLTKKERRGFTVVEWGGLTMNKLQ